MALTATLPEAARPIDEPVARRQRASRPAGSSVATAGASGGTEVLDIHRDMKSA